MRYVKLFEEYKEDLKRNIDFARDFGNTNFMKSIDKIGSFIDDLIHFDFNLIPYSMKNKTGFEKIRKLMVELSVLKTVMKRGGDDIDFEDLYRYGINDKVLLYLDDADVQDYLKKDPKLLNRLSTHKYMDLFSDYADWKESNGLNEAFNFKTIHYYSCNSCGNLFKSKEECKECKECSSPEISPMDEVDWYKQAD